MKSRLDLLLVARGLAPTRQKAQAMILAGLVEVDGRRVDKAGTAVAEDAAIGVTGPPHPYVSRGGIKLAAALDAFGIDPTGAVCLDVGASTGGFTDCLLQRGAARVYAVDVGSGQIDARLRSDPRVILREKVNARFLSSAHVPEAVRIAAVDVSFISLRLVLPAIVPRLAPGAFLVALVKPQFEAGRGEVPRGGVVQSEQTRKRVLSEVEQACRAASLETLGSLESPIRGARGNVEFLLVVRRPDQEAAEEVGPSLDNL
jgi:23S rRNA (cytidine1920-2'-O)/16S rRNA (cytidine1409-2'-O)-methyltransferase